MIREDPMMEKHEKGQAHFTTEHDGFYIIKVQNDV